MEQLIVHNEENKPLYEIHLKESYKDLVTVIRNLGVTGRKLCVVSDSNVMPLYGESICSML